MVTFLFKKSFQLKSLKKTIYSDLWGKRGVFTTIRIVGNKPKYILLLNHIIGINSTLNKLGIRFILSEKKVFDLIQPLLKKNKIYDHLLRIAISSKFISFSLRIRLKPSKNYYAIINSYQRKNPVFKNLYYKKIIKILDKIDSQKCEVILSKKGFLLEGCTSNILCISDKIIYIPIDDYYKGVTMNYLLRNTKRKIKRINISLKNLFKYDEILLVGSGKGVLRLNYIPEIGWKSKSDIVHKELIKSYNKLL